MRKVLRFGSKLKVQLYNERLLQVGDKLASRHGQKGVIGQIRPAAQMPLLPDGRRPDILVNPLAYPSRMTMGQLMEMRDARPVAGRSKCVMPPHIRAGLGDVIEDADEHILGEVGYDPTMPDGMLQNTTGEPWSSISLNHPPNATPIEHGYCYYMVLDHFVVTKVHWRMSGPVDALSHQPTHGRANAGGYSVGEMERLAMVAHGASALVRERTFLLSDPSSIWICGCGAALCAGCPAEDPGRRMEVPHSFVVFVQALRSMHIGVRVVEDGV